MKSQDILLIEDAGKPHEAQIAALAKAGFSVQSIQPDSVEQLQDRLATSTPDIVLHGTGKNIPDLESVAALLAQDHPGIPVIAIINKLTRRNVTAAEGDGAAAVVQRGQSEDLLRTVKKELRSVFLHRKVSQLESGLESTQLQQRIIELENTLKEKEARCIELMEDSRNAIAYVHEGIHIYANRAYCNLLGHESDDEIIGTPLLNWIDLHHNVMVTRLLRNPYARDDATKVKVKLAKDDTEADMELAMARFDQKLCTQITVRGNDSDTDLSSPIALRHHDMITGLYNRQYFMKLLDDNISKHSRSGTFQALTFILLDNFKTIREMVGIAASDTFISEISELLREIYGQEHAIARFGDYTFAVLNNYNYKERAVQLAENLRSRMEERSVSIDGRKVSATCSIGICEINEHVKDAQNAHSRADLACELARTSGGNQVHIHSTTIDAQIDHEVDTKMDDMIRKTIEDDRFYLVYQPVISLKGKSAGHYEALLRVLDEDGQAMLPGQFLSLAEKSPLIMEIDRRVIQIAFKTLHEKHEAGEKTAFFIKLSGETISDPKLPEWIDLQLQRFDLKGESIVFEIAESVMAGNPNLTGNFTQAIRALGCKVAIEHVGYANKPELLKYIPVDYLKIDGSLINNLATSTDNQKKIKVIVDLARKHDMLCIAEHVDDAHCLVMLWEYNIDYIQGYLVQEPRKELDHDFEDEAALAGLID